MVTDVRDSIKIEILPECHQYFRLLDDFHFYSDVLARWCCIPAGFIFDLESVPFIRGTNPEAGAIHDYLCRTDSDPVVSKTVAAQVYLEFQRFYDGKEKEKLEIEDWLNHAWDWIRRGVKTGIVWIAPGYFHKFKAMATYEEISA
jgi:Protein of unknown function (DUF1353).